MIIYNILTLQQFDDIQSDRSLYNFCTAAHKVHQENSINNDSTIKNAFQTLSAVSQGLNIKWSIVYGVTNMRIYFKIFETPTTVGEHKIFLKQPGQAVIKYVDFNAFDFNCHSSSKVLDLDFNHTGAVNQYFVEYSASINKEFIAKTFTF